MVITNDAKHIPRVLNSLKEQDYSPLELIVVDNDSTDGGCALLENAGLPVRVFSNKSNEGFSRSQNKAIREARGDWILCLNPDTKLEPSCVSELVRAGESHPTCGAVAPKILKLDEAGDHPGETRLDSAGVYMTRALRHFDRGSNEVDRGQYDTPEYVFAYTGAVVLFRRRMIDDVSIGAEFMDEDFFLYREDADLSWRMQVLGWQCLYWPFAVAHHIRRVLPYGRAKLPAFINMHSTKNRFLMRIQNITPRVYRKVFWKTTIRDLGIFAYVISREWTSLPGLWFVLRNLRTTLRKRRFVQGRRRAFDADLMSWFEDFPVTRPVPDWPCETAGETVRSREFSLK